MGFLDKLQQTAKETLDKGKEKLEDVQADRASDKLLRDLGAWYYAGRTGRDDGQAAAHVERLIAELQAHEAAHGELGAKEEAVPEPPPAAPAAPEAPVATGEPAPPPAPAATGEPAPPPAPAAPPTTEAPAAEAPPAPPVTSGPPPPPPA
jgi:hypothetical protein